MAGARKNFELLFKLTASLGGNFHSTFNAAVQAQKRLSDSVKNVNALQSKIDGYNKANAAIQQNQQKLQRLTAEHDRLQSELAQTAQKKRDLQRAMETAEAEGNIEEYKRLQKELSDTNKEYSRLNEKCKANQNQIQQATAKIEEQQRSLEELAQELREAGLNTDDLERANERLKNSYERLQASQERLKNLNQQQEKIKQNISATKTQILGTAGAYNAVAAAIYAGPIKSSMAFEKQMSNVGTLLEGDVQGRLAELSKSIISISNATGAGTGDLTDGLYQVISAFGDTADSAKILETATKAATAGGATPTDAINLLSAVTKGYGDTSAEAQQKVADWAFQTVKLGQTSFPELAASMGKVIPLASTLAVKQEDLFGVMATLTGVTGNTAEVSTQLKAAMQGFLSPSSNMQKSLQKLGYANGQALLESKGLQGALTALQESVGGDQLAFAKLFSSVEAQTAVLALAGEQADNFASKTAQMYDASGAAATAFATATDNAESKMQRAKTAVSNLGLVLGNTFLPYVETAADKLAGVAQKVADFAQANPQLVQTVLKVVGALAALKLGGLGLKLGFQELKLGVVNVQYVLELLKSKFLIAQAGSIGLAGRLKLAGKGVLTYFGNVGSALGGVTSALGNILTNNPLARAAGGLFTRVGSIFTAGAQSLAGRLLGPLSGVGSRAVPLILAPFRALGGQLGGVLSGLSGVIARSPLGTIGRVVSGAFGKLGTLIGPVGNALKTAMGPLGKLGSTLLGPLGGIAGKILPVVGVVTAVITVVQLLRKNFDKVREAVGRIFGDKGLEIFDKIVAAVTAAGDAIKNVFSGGNMDAARQKIESIFGAKGTAVFDGFIRAAQTVGSAIGSLIGFITEHVVPVAEQVLGVIVSDVIPGIVGGIQQAAPVIMQIVQAIANFIAGIIPVIGGFIAGIMPVISEIITFVQTNVFPIVQQIFSFIVSTVLPAIVSGVQFLAATITAVLSAVLPVVQTVFTTIWNIIQLILQQIFTTVQAVLPSVLAIFQNVFNTIGGVVNGLATVLSGLIQFITGVFSGNWGQAWEGIKSVFSGAWDALTSIVKGVINNIIGIINGAIAGLNSIKIPDWVPVVGGKGVNIPQLPTFARGTARTPSTFIAGEKGPELITNAPGMTVYTAERTQKILETSNRAAAAVKAAPAAVQVGGYGGNHVAEVKTAPEVTRNPGRGGGTQNITVNNSPTIVVNGDKPDDLEQKLEANNQKLIREIREMQRQDAEDERRAVYE